MIEAGTSSKWVGNGSSPNLRASSQAQSIASRNRSISLDGDESIVAIRNLLTLLGGNRLTLSEEFSQRGIHFFFIGDGYGGKLLVGDFVVGRHERAGGAIVSLADLAIAKDVTQFHYFSDELPAGINIPGTVI